MNIFLFHFIQRYYFFLHGNISLQEKDVRGKILTKQLFGLKNQDIGTIIKEYRINYWNKKNLTTTKCQTVHRCDKDLLFKLDRECFKSFCILINSNQW